VKFDSLGTTQGMYDGKYVDQDYYTLSDSSPMSTKEIDIYIDYREDTIRGDQIAYGSWDDIPEEELYDFVQQMEKEGLLIRPLSKKMKQRINL